MSLSLHFKIQQFNRDFIPATPLPYASIERSQAIHFTIREAHRSCEAPRRVNAVFGFPVNVMDLVPVTVDVTPHLQVFSHQQHDRVKIYLLDRFPIVELNLAGWLD
jgi:hypothetical protein